MWTEKQKRITALFGAVVLAAGLGAGAENRYHERTEKNRWRATLSEVLKPALTDSLEDHQLPPASKADYCLIDMATDAIAGQVAANPQKLLTVMASGTGEKEITRAVLSISHRFETTSRACIGVAKTTSERDHAIAIRDHLLQVGQNLSGNQATGIN